MNLASILTNSSAGDPQHTALKLDGLELTYAQLDDATAHFAGLLHANGFAPGDRVGIMLPNIPQFAVCYYGVLRAGATPVRSCCSPGRASRRTRRTEQRKRAQSAYS
jgi:long-chain acyl-CoA synthetase